MILSHSLHNLTVGVEGFHFPVFGGPFGRMDGNEIEWKGEEIFTLKLSVKRWGLCGTHIYFLAISFISWIKVVNFEFLHRSPWSGIRVV